MKRRWWIPTLVTLLGFLVLVSSGSVMHAEEQAFEHIHYLPLVLRPAVPSTTQHVLLRPDNVFLSRSGATYAEALAGAVSVQQQDLTTGAWNVPPGVYSDRYTLTRGYSTYDLGELSGRTVVSAALELHLCSAATPSMENITLTLYAGAWAGPVTTETWDQLGAKLGSATILPTHQIAAGDEWLTLPLDGTLPAQLRFVWKADESQAYPYNTSAGAAFDLADCYGIGNPNLTALHFWVKDE
jgi:hypothetical protein